MTNRPNNTCHHYEVSEIISMHHGGMEKNRVTDAVFAVIERDMSTNGNAAFSTNFSTIAESVGLANPVSMIFALLFYNKWFNLMKNKFHGTTGKSYMLPAARTFLVATTVFICRLPKSRFITNLSIVSLKEKLKEIAKINPSECDEIDMNLRNSIQWAKQLGPANPKTMVMDRKDGTTYGIDIVRVMELFALILSRTSQIWEKVAKKRVHEKKKKANPEDPSIDNDILTDEEASEETALALEKVLIVVSHIIYAVDTMEKRRCKEMNGKPSLINEALKQLPNPEKWQNEFTKITGKSEKIFTRPVALVFGSLLVVANSICKQPHPLPLVLLSILEIMAREIGNDRLNFISAVIFTARNKSLNWNYKEDFVIEDLMKEPEISDLMKLYEDCMPNEEQDPNADISDPEKLAKRRMISIPMEYIDKNTFRGRGRSTLDQLKKATDACKLDISKWSAEEISKSHGLGIELSNKASNGLPTYMSTFMDNKSQINPPSNIVDCYVDQVRQIMLEEEESYGCGACNEKDMMEKRYPKWVKTFKSVIPHAKGAEADTKKSNGASSNGKKKKSTMASSKGKKSSTKVVEEEEDMEEEEEEEYTKADDNGEEEEEDDSEEECMASTAATSSTQMGDDGGDDVTSSKQQQEEDDKDDEKIPGKQEEDDMKDTRVDPPKNSSNRKKGQSKDKEQLKKNKKQEMGDVQEVILVRPSQPNTLSLPFHLKEGQIIRIAKIQYEDVTNLFTNGNNDDTSVPVTLSMGENGNKQQKNKKSNGASGKNKKKKDTNGNGAEEEEDKKKGKKKGKKNKKSDTMDVDQTQDEKQEDIGNEESEGNDGNDNNSTSNKKKKEKGKKKKNSKKRTISEISDESMVADDSNNHNKSPEVKSKRAKKNKVADIAKFDLISVVKPRILFEKEKKSLDAPIAQTPTGNAKKFVFVTPQKVYKGPYNMALDKDVSALQRTLYRIFRMKNQWGDKILLDQEIVFDEDKNMAYLCSDNIGCQDVSKWVIEEKVLKTHDQKSVKILNRESSGIVQLSKLIQSEHFDKIMEPAIIDLAARYLIGSGGGHFAEIIVSNDGERFAAIDIEENREKIPLMTDSPPPCLLDLLFVKGKRPAKSNERFYSLFHSTLEPLKKFLENVSKEDTETTGAYASKIGYTGAPTQSMIEKRVETLLSCIKKEEEGKNNDSGMLKIPTCSEMDE